MKVYLAGPMRGYPGWNFPAFEEAERRWEQAGHHVFSPMTLARAMGYGPNQNTSAEPGSKEGRDHLQHVMLSDLACIYASDALALLPGWESSRGATVEVALALFIGLRLFDADTMEDITSQVNATPWAPRNQGLASGIIDPMSSPASRGLITFGG